MNQTDHWPYIHVCFFDRQCLKMFWLYGWHLRIQYKKRYTEIVGLVWLADKIGHWRERTQFRDRVANWIKEWEKRLDLAADDRDPDPPVPPQ